MLVARGKGITFDLIEQAGRRSVDGRQFFTFHAQLRQCGKQGPGIGVLRVEEHFVGHADLYDLAAVHHRHPVRHVGNDAQVVGDVNDGHVLLFLQAADQVQDLGLNGHVKSGRRLVADQDLRTAGHGDGNDHALAHAAGELVRILFVAALRIGNAHRFQDAVDLFPGFPALEALVQFHALLDLKADGFQGVQAGHRVLRDHGDLLAAYLQPVFLFVFGQVLSLIHDGAVGDFAVLVQHADEALGEHALAAAGFAHDGQGLAFIQIQRSPADGRQHLAAQGEGHFHVPCGKDRFLCQDLFGAFAEINGIQLVDSFIHFRALLYTWFRGSHASENALPTR